ncbi:hypothetical protein ACN6AT_26300 [Streptomyces sp. JL4002]|uniref:hypothetical protein n=1 Tax=Streptomyces sp. JL4002 TaxID=3404781 RepID=UPI003B282693
MAKNKQQKQPKQQRSTGQDPTRSSDGSPEQSSQAPSPMDMAHKSKQKKFGHN